MQEKVSKVSPKQQNKTTTKEIETLTKKTQTTSLKVLKNQQTVNSSKILFVTNEGINLVPDSNQDSIVLDSTILDELALNIQNSMDLDISGDKKIVTESLEVGENWEPLIHVTDTSIDIEWEPFTKEDELLETAKAYLGVPYIWAANGPLAFDCSGYTKYIFKKSGITLPRYSGHQANVGTKIAYDELQKGDLVFFDTAKGFHKKVNHVGIYIGDNKFIHASSARKQVMITSFSKKKFYKNRFLHGRRILNSDSSFASYNTKENYNIHTN
jgi:hypothetical protein